MKLQAVLFIILMSFNLISLYFILNLFICNGILDCWINEQDGRGYARGLAYLFYITELLNLYFLCYIAIKKAFRD